MKMISQICAKGLDAMGNTVEWVVATHLDHLAAYQHHTLCHAYLARAKETLPAHLSERDKVCALSMLRPPHDPVYETMRATNVTYMLDSFPVMESAPQDSGNPWRALDPKDLHFINLVDGTARRFMRDEEQEGAPEDPLPPQETAVMALWTIGVDPSLPVPGYPKDTAGDLYYGMLADAVEERRRLLRARRAS